VKSRQEELVLDGIRIPLGPHITPEILRNLRAGTYERPEARVLRERLDPGDVVVEVGGGLGYTSALCAKRVGSANVHVYEANLELEKPIRELYRLNQVSPDLHMYGLGPRDETRELYVTADFWESSFTKPKARVSSTVSVPVRACETELARYRWRPNFLILDIEGGEYSFCRGVSLRGFDKLLCEVHPQILGRRRLWALRRALRKRGFRRDEACSSSTVWYFERGRGRPGAPAPPA
jgi:FkbM family methyltransferase